MSQLVSSAYALILINNNVLFLSQDVTKMLLNRIVNNVHNFSIELERMFYDGLHSFFK